MMDMEENNALFERYFSFWPHLSEQEKRQFLESSGTAVYQKGMNVHGGSNDCVGVLLVKSGQLRAYMLSEDGKDITLYRLFQGDVCILSASCVLDAITFDIFIDAEENSELLLVNSSVYHRLADKNIYMKSFGYELATTRFSDVMWAMEQILFMSFDRRLAIFLLDELSKTTGGEIRMTHEQIAKYMGSAREVVSRMLKYFSGEGIVSLSRGGVTVLDRARLRQLAQETRND